MKKYLSLLLSLLLLVTATYALSSCSGEEDTLYYLNFKPEIASVYHEIAVAYEKETGKKLRVVTAASGTYEQTLKSEIGKKDAPVLFQINGPRGYAAWKDYCLDLNGSKIYNLLADKSLCVTDGSGVYGIPYVVEGYGIIYNKSLTDRYFALPNRQTNVNSMEEIKSFAALKTVVEDMTRNKSALGIEGVFAATSLKSGEDWRFQTHLANIPVHYEFMDRGIDLSSDQTKTVDFRFSEQYKNIFDLYINHSTTDKKLLGSKEVADSMAEFALEKCVMVQNGNWAWGQIKNVGGNKVQEANIKMLPIYTGIAGEENMGLCIGTENFFAINKMASPAKQMLAQDFLEWLFTSETGKDFVTKKLEFITPFTSFESSDIPNDPLAREVDRYLKTDNVENVPWSFTLFPGQNFKNDFGAALLQYAQGTKTWNEVKALFVEKWKAES